MPGKLTNRKVERETPTHPANHEGLRGGDTQAAKVTTEQVLDMRIEHVKDGATPEELGKKYGITPRRVVEFLTGRAWKWMGLQDVFRRKEKPPKVVFMKTCRQCGKEFQASTANRKYCSNKCVTDSQRGKQVEDR